ncbi:MAG: endolytic transglycosylase MltG [Acidobacteria bacterium]|nr:endolytic transglycosylase MltG [Acidobacteriota bacterium]
MIRRGIAAILLLLLLGVVSTTVVVYARLHQPFKGYAGPEQFVDIPPRTGTRAIARRLAAAGVVRDEFTFLIALRLTGRGAQLKAGEYRFDRPAGVYDVIDQIADGRVYLRAITFPEGLTIREMSRIYEANGLGQATAFVEAAGNVSLVKDLDGNAPDLEGYLFPETYSLPRSATAGDLVRAMVDRFRKVLTTQMNQTGVPAEGIRRLVTLASIVEKETSRPEERPTIAAVYANRLKLRMALQCDPTVIYALQKEGKFAGNLTKAHLSFDSPYNTYRYAGLPPGPIASPGEASLRAALAPADVPYLYFVSRNDGSHVFATTLQEHNRNVFNHQVLPFRQKRLEEQKRQPQRSQRPQRVRPS